jgi:hypothetical protein
MNKHRGNPELSYKYSVVPEAKSSNQNGIRVNSVVPGAKTPNQNGIRRNSAGICNLVRNGGKTICSPSS